MLVSEDYPWGKLLREYATYCAVGCINVAVFFLISAMGYFLTDMMIPKFKPLAIKANLFGMDINKKGTPMGKVKV